MRSRQIGKAVLTAGIFLGLLSGGNLLALTDEEIFRDFRFNFLNPGARALGLGGAFIAAADDATAAEANPAALHYISQMELFAEYRSIDYATQTFTTSNTVGSNELGAPVYPFLDLQAVTNREDTDFFSFASFAFPFTMGKVRATIALSRQVVLDVTTTLSDPSLPLGQRSTRLDFALGSFPTEWINPDTFEPEVYTIVNSSAGQLEAELVNTNLAFSASVGDLSFGLTATQANLDMQSNLVNEAVDARGILQTINPRVDRQDLPAFLELKENIRTRSVIDDSDSDLAFTLGLHYHPDSMFKSGFSPIRFGAVYRKGADLEVDQFLLEDSGDGEFVETETFKNKLKVPDRYGIGVSGELGRHWVFAMDMERVEYSDLLEGFVPGVNFFTSGLLADAFEQDPSKQIRYDVDDATVVHAGAEYTIVTKSNWNFSFRGGYYNAPDNRIRMVEFNSTDEDLNETFLDVFRGGEATNHFTAGFEVRMPIGLHLQFAGDFADDLDSYLVSAIYRFGRTRR